MLRRRTEVRSLSAAVTRLIILTSEACAAPPDALPSNITITGSALYAEVGHTMSVLVLHKDHEHVATSPPCSL